MKKIHIILVVLLAFVALACTNGVASAIALDTKYVGNTMVDLSWTQYESSFSKYELCRNGVPIVAITNRTDTFYRDTGLIKGKAYEYWLRVYSATGVLKETRTTSATTGEVHGTITQDTTWTAASSPYMLTGNVLRIYDGATLTIAGGVLVSSNNIPRYRSDISVQKKGALNADGSRFCNVTISVYDSHADIKNCFLGFANIRLDNSNDSAITDNIDCRYVIVSHSSNNTITGNTARLIQLTSSNNNSIMNNTVSNNPKDYGIYLSRSSDNVITSNTVSNSSLYGIYLQFSSNNTVRGNEVSNNQKYGISLRSSSNNAITGNNVSDNRLRGISLSCSSDNNIITGNTASNNEGGGIYLSYDPIWDFTANNRNNILTDNIVSNNRLRGIYLYSSSDNVIANNTISNNSKSGISLYSSSDNNSIYNNYFNNTNNSYDNGNNTWNITKTAGTNIVGGPYLGGNYWSDYDGTDTDTPADGLGDTKLPYNCSGRIRNGGDYHPLILKAPDLVIHEKRERWIDKATGTYNVSYTLKNIGDGTVSAGHRTSLFVDGVLKETHIVPVDLKPNEVYPGTFYTLLTISGENDTIKVCADYNDDIKESDETNNCRGNVWEAPPDLVVREIKRKQVDKVFGKYKIEYDIKNIGKGTASAGHNTSLFVDGMLKETKVVQGDLKPNGIYTDTFDTNIKRSGELDTIKVCADHNNDVEESKETNNCRGNVWKALLKVNITSPVKNFEVQKDEKVDIVASVKDDLNNMANGSNIDSVVASFTTEKKKIDLHDDGKHKDGGKDDGVYGNTWAPTKTGDCTITVTAKKTDFKDGVDKVNGIVIAKQVLEIPAQFKNVHPYRNERGEDAPVFQRGVENPQFKITNLTGTKPSGVKLIIDISEPLMGGGFRIVKNVNVAESWSATPILVDWDWSNNSGRHRNPSNIPVGIYKAKAKLINSTTNRILIESDEKEFYVIFNYPKGELYVKSQNAYVIPHSGISLGEFEKYEKYPLHQYNATIWKDALNQVNGRTSVGDASNSLRGFAHSKACYPDPANIHNPPRCLVEPCNSGSNQNAWWYKGGTLKFLRKRTGVCVDFASLMTAYCRGVGIPARSMTGFGGNDNKKVWAHEWVEAWGGRWYWHEPTWSSIVIPVPLGGTFGTDLYPRDGVVCRPRPQYYVAAPGPGGLVATNVYDRYTFCADVMDFKFIDEPPEGYDYGQNVQFNVTVGNTGAINITKPLCVRIYDVPRGILVGAPVLIISERIADSSNSGQSVFRQFDQDLPDYGWLNSFYELIRGRDVMVVVFYVSSNNVCISTDIYKKSIPGLCVEPIPTITVDGENRELTNVTFTYLNQTTERSWKEETYVLDIPAVARILTEKEEAENYSKVVVSTENPDSVAHNYSFSMQLAGKGDAIYVPSLGSVTTNLTGLNVTTNYFVTYLQANGTNDYVSIHEFSKNATIESIEMIEYRGIKGLLINATWNQTLNRESSQDFSIYFSRRNVSGLSFSEIHSTFAGEIVDNEDSLSTIGITTSSRCRVGDILPINITVFNNGVKSETIDVMLNVTRVMKTIPYTTIGLYNDSAITTVQPQTERTVTFTADIPESTSSGFWDIDVITDKGIGAKAAFAVEDAFDLNCTQNITVEQHHGFMFNASITNRWDTTIHDVNATIDLFHCFDTSDPLEQQIGDLLPGESRIISWQLNATSAGELPIEVLVTSDDGGSDIVRTTITSLSPPVLWIPNVITHTSAPDFGTSKTVSMNVTIQNLGDLTANNVQVQLILPENVTSTVLTHNIGDLSGGKQKNVSIDITFSTQKDFAFDVVAEDDANHSAIGTVMMSFSAMALPDLTLISDDIQVIFNENATVSATIHNIGTADASNIIVQFFNGDPDAGGTQIGSNQTIASIAHESTDTAQVTWTAILGTHDIFVRVDPYNSIPETSENNNHAFRQITVSGVALPDYAVELTVEGANATTTSPAENATYTLTVKNTGTKTDNYILSVDNPDGAAIANLSTYSINNLAADTAQNIVLNVTDETEGNFRVNVTVISDNDHLNATDSVTTTTVVETAVCGDVTGDSKVTMGDTRRIEMWLLYPEEYPINNPWAADVTGDGEVTGDDARRIIMWLSDPEQYPLACSTP